jgi:hypothetical protein
MTKAIAVQCKAISKQSGQQCKRKAIPGGTVCRYHGGGAQQVKAKAAVRAEVMAWGLGDSHVDPGEVLLRLVTQSAARAERYALLLEEAYEAAERLKRSFDAGALEIDESKVMADTAREDLDRIFNTGGVAVWSATRTELRRTSASTSPAKRSEGLLILKRRNESAARTSPPKRSPRASLNAPYGWPNDKVSSWWKWFRRRCGKLIFHRSRHLRSKPRSLGRRGS